MMLSCSRLDVNSKSESFEIDNYPLSYVSDMLEKLGHFAKNIIHRILIVAFLWWFALFVKIN